MFYFKTTYPLQQKASGEELFIHVYTFRGHTPGPTVYLQANIHGPEIFGTVLLGKLIQYLETHVDFPGTVIIVPCANPIAVNAVGYNALTGRWNLHNGANWNRIFTTHVAWNSLDAQKKYYEELLLEPNLSIEHKLAATLKLLSAAATHVVDIHTTGSDNEAHLFSHSMHSDVFKPLGARVHILWEKKEDAVGAFDESHVAPFLDNMPLSQIPAASTWEVYHHGEINEAALLQRFAELVRWLDSVWSHKKEESAKFFPPLEISIKNATHLVSPVAGYYSWQKKVGERVQKGEEYALVYQPWCNTMVSVRAFQTFHLMSIYGVGAIEEGQQIAWIGLV